MKPKLGDRSLFPGLGYRAYLSHGAVSPPPQPALDATAALLTDYGQRGLAAVGDSRRALERVRAKFAQLIGSSPEDVALIANTSMGVIDIAACFPWRAGDRVVCFEGEFPTNVTPWQQAARQHDLTVELLPLSPFFESPEAGLAVLESALKVGVRLVAVSAVQFQSGLTMPLAELISLSHSYGAEVFVDAIQACGVVPLDVAALGVDYLTCGSHKWLMGLEGCGFLYAASSCARQLQPHLAGWLSHDLPLEFLFKGAGHLRYDRPLKRSIQRFEWGAPSVFSFASLEVSLGLLLALGVESIYEHVTSYLDTLEAELVALGFESVRTSYPAGRSGILGLVPPDSVESVSTLVRALDGAGISCTAPDGLLRFAPHWPNHPDEIPLIVDALREAMKL